MIVKMTKADRATKIKLSCDPPTLNTAQTQGWRLGVGSRHGKSGPMEPRTCGLGQPGPGPKAHTVGKQKKVKCLLA